MYLPDEKVGTYLNKSFDSVRILKIAKNFCFRKVCAVHAEFFLIAF